MTGINEIEDRLYELQPEGNGLDRFPLCTSYLIVDDKVALIEAGCAVQAQEITTVIEKLVGDLERVSYLVLTHAHPDHAGAAAPLTEKLPNAKVIAHPGVTKALGDSSIVERIMRGFKSIFGEQTEDRLGVMRPVAQERLSPVQDGESLPLGKRGLKAIHTPGHDAYHLCFLDTLSGGVFCGDALGGYFSEIDLLAPPYIPGTNFDEALKSIVKLEAFHPKELFFSHGCAVRDGAEYIQIAQKNLITCQRAAYEALLKGKSLDEIALDLINVLTGGSELVTSELIQRMQISVMGAESYRLFFKKMQMI